jgi:hypothetical protein
MVVVHVTVHHQGIRIQHLLDARFSRSCRNVVDHDIDHDIDPSIVSGLNESLEVFG